MPTYDGIGTSITHNVEVDGNLFLQDIEGGPDSTRVPLEIFSNLVSSSVESANSRMLRLRVQNYGETNTDNSYVTDMGIRGDPGKDYFFITAPQNTSNVGDQNTFVISKTSNVGIGTTDPTKTLEVVGDIKCQTLSASTITGASPLVIDSAEPIVIRAPVQMPSDAPMSIGTMTVSNIFHSDQLTMSAHVVMGSDKTLTTSNIVANTGDNLLVGSSLEVGTSNLFVDTATGRVGIGTNDPKTKLHVSNDLHLQASSEAWNTTAGTGLYLRYSTNSGQDEGYIQAIDRSTATKKPMVLEASQFYFSSGNVGLGTDDPLEKLDVYGVSRISEAYPRLDFYTTTGRSTAAWGNSTGAAGDYRIYSNGDASDGTKRSLNFDYGQNSVHTSRMVINAAGNVGIGVTSPVVKLDVMGSNVNGKSLQLRSGDISSGTDSSQIIFSYDGNPYNSGGYAHSIRTRHNASADSGNAIDFWLWNTSDTANSNTLGNKRVMTIEGNGNVGIGAASPLRKLDVRSGTSSASDTSNWISGAFGPELSAGDRVVIGNLWTKACIGAHNSALSAWADLTINSGGGNVGIGRTNPSYTLDVNGTLRVESTIYTPGSVIINNYSPTLYLQDIDHYSAMIHCNSNLLYFLRGGVNSTTWVTVNGLWPLYLDLSNNEARFGGSVYVTNTLVHSDDRLKINEERITNATETLMKLDPQIYDKLANIYLSNVISREAGLIVQDVWYDAPELRYMINLPEDANPPDEKPPKSENIQEDPDYSDWGSTPGHLNYFSLIPYLIKSNQEQQALIDNLDTQLQAEKQKMASLLARIEALENSS
jgi:hypothetical protein